MYEIFICGFSRNKRNENKIIRKKKRELTAKRKKNSREHRNIGNFNFNELALFHTNNVPFPFLFKTSRFKIAFFPL